MFIIRLLLLFRCFLSLRYWGLLDCGLFDVVFLVIVLTGLLFIVLGALFIICLSALFLFFLLLLFLQVHGVTVDLFFERVFDEEEFLFELFVLTIL